MNQGIINFILQQMTACLNNSQMVRLLGHEKIDTTLHYAMVKQSNVKSAHRKYIG